MNSINFRSYLGLLTALLLYLILAFSYFFIVPMFEAPDEWTHTGHIKYIAQGNGLPVMLPGQGIWGGQQPPLYYAMGALLVQPFDLSDFEDYIENSTNPHASIGYALDPGNKNVYLHTPAENFPYSGLSLTVHILRLYSMLFGVITVIFVYLTACEIFDSSTLLTTGFGFANDDYPSNNRQSLIANPKSFATIVALFVAAQPMLAFITASVANEPANMAFSAIGVWLAQRYVLRGPTPGWKRAVALGITMGLVSLSKMTGLALGLVIAVAWLQTAIANRKQPGAARLLWRDGFIIGLLFMAVGGWWYWRNYQLYGDFFQRGLYKIYFNQDPQPLSLSEFIYHLAIGEVSFWATFGWLNIVAPDWVYNIYRVISRIGVLGVIVAVGIQFIWHLRNTQHATRIAYYVVRVTKIFPDTLRPIFPLLIHLVFPLAVAFSLTRLVATEGGLQGRQLLPALGSMAIVIVWGWQVLTPARLRLPVMGALVAVWVGLAFWLPYSIVAEAYTPRPLLTEANLPNHLHRLDYTYNDEMKLIGVDIGADVVRPGERVPVTAYWQALKPMDINYSVFVHLIGRNRENIGQLNSYPGLGLHPTTTLQPGQIVADTYPVQINGGSLAPARVLVNIGLFDFNQPGRPGIPATDPNGSRIPPTVGRLKLVPHQWPAIDDESSLIAEFADGINLTGYNFDGCTSPNPNCILTLHWQAQSRPSTDYTVFVQLWQNDKKITGFDAPPLQNDYPTGLWDAGETIIDPHLLDLSTLFPGDYQVLIGLYNFETGQRLPAGINGEPLPDHAVNLGTITIGM